MNARRLILSLALMLVGGCGQTPAATPVSTPGSTPAAPTALPVEFVSSFVLPKPNLFPAYPTTTRVRNGVTFPDWDPFSIQTKDPTEQVFAFYDQQLPHYGWQLKGAGDLIHDYIWHSDEEGVEWDVVARIMNNGHNPDHKFLRFAKEARVDRLLVYPNAQIKTKSAGSGATQHLEYQSPASADTIADYYREKLPDLGWEVTANGDRRTGPFISTGYIKPEKLLTLAFTTTPEGGTLVTLDTQEAQ
jgi:hypothetical protein